jgi:hypothetical protein
MTKMKPKHVTGLLGLGEGIIGESEEDQGQIWIVNAVRPPR